MNLFRPQTRGRLSGDDVDTLVRWGMRAAVQDVKPSDEVWLRIASRARSQRAQRAGMQAARRAFGRVQVSFEPFASFAGLTALLSFMIDRMFTRGRAPYPDTRWCPDYFRNATIGPNITWYAFTSPDIVDFGTRLFAARLV